MRGLSKAVLSCLMVFILSGNAQETGPCNQDQIQSARRRFAYEFYSQIRQEANAGENILLAPTTLGSALAMVLVGSGGNTRQQILDSLFPNLASDVAQDSFKCLVGAYADPYPASNPGKDKKNPTMTLRTASKLYGEKYFKFDRTFLQQTRDYGVSMEEVEFATDAEIIREHINRWVSNVTGGNIRDFFAPGDITAQTALAIVSAIYFEGSWKTPFEERATSASEFTKQNNEVIQVDFMSNTDRFKTYFSENIQANMLEMPYLDDGQHEVSMILILPQRSMEYTEQSLTEDILPEELSLLFSQEAYRTIVFIPKFNLTADYTLTNALEKMGMSDLTSPGLANLRGMLSPKNKRVNPLYLETAIHKTVLKVNERGTVAAGVTGLSIVPLSLPPQFIGDKPFLLMVYEKKTQNILFIGRVDDPSSDTGI